jgi:hypothetical protein
MGAFVMAKFINAPSLDIDVDSGSNRAEVSVTGTIEFDDLELQLMPQGLVITVTGRLFGDDPSRDDDLGVQLNAQTFTGTQDRQASYAVGAQRVAGKTLNEDIAGKDEVFARLTLANSLSPTPVATRDSNVIEFFFRNN